MKTGAGDDPFADAGDEETDGDGSAGNGEAVPREVPESSDAGAAADDDGPDDASTTSREESAAKADIPWVLRRGSVKDDRPNVTQFFLRDETDRAERRFHNEVEELLDADVYTLDLREAAYLVAMEHPDEVATTLQSWGYDYLD